MCFHEIIQVPVQRSQREPSGTTHDNHATKIESKILKARNSDGDDVIDGCTTKHFVIPLDYKIPTTENETKDIAVSMLYILLQNAFDCPSSSQV